MSSTAEWYYLLDGQQLGPVGSRELKVLADKGRLQPTDLIWRDGLTNWVPAARVKGLFPDTDVYGLEEEPAAPAPAPAKEDDDFSPGGARPKVSRALRHGYAPIVKRFLALILDGLVLLGLGFTVGLVLGFVMAMTLGPARAQEIIRQPGSQVVGQLVGLVLNCLYFAGLESSERQATVGKRALRIRVVDLSGERISFLRGVGRWLGKSVSVLVLIAVLIVAGLVSKSVDEFRSMVAGAFLVFVVVLLGGYLLAFFTPRKQALHDLLAKTLVVND
jgi:uncharacterized RDD family membrane protein YckC